MNQRVREKHMKMIEEKAKHPDRGYWTQTRKLRHYQHSELCYYPSKNSIEQALDEQLP